LVTSTWPLAHSEPYLRWTTSTAAPKCISGKTSYLQARLEFLLCPQVSPQFCNTGGFGPRRGLTLASPWPWVAHPVSGLICATRRPIKTRFRCGSSTLPYLNLAAQINSPDHSSIGTPLAADTSEEVPNMPLTACGYMVSGSLSSPSWAAFHLSVTVLVHYRSPRVLSLGGWSPLLPTRFLVSRGTQASSGSPRVFVYRAITVCGGPFQKSFD